MNKKLELILIIPTLNTIPTSIFKKNLIFEIVINLIQIF
jgi:hypothetical protein